MEVLAVIPAVRATRRRSFLNRLVNAIGVGVLAFSAASHVYDLYCKWQQSKRRDDLDLDRLLPSRLGQVQLNWRAMNARTYFRTSPLQLLFTTPADCDVLQASDTLAQDEAESSLGLEVLRRVEALGLELREELTEADFADILAALDAGMLQHHEPASEAAICALPCRTVPEVEMPQAAVSTQSCSICLDDFCCGKLVKVLPCQHEFHSPCVDRWLRLQGRAATCPMCKAPVWADKCN